MSYILDALKKSDAERQSNQGPTLQSIQRPPQRRSSNAVVWAVAGTLSVVSLLGAGVYFGYQASRGAQSTSSQNPAALADNGERSANIESSSEQAGQLRSSDKPAQNSPAVVSESSSVPTVAFNELPDNVRNEIPALTFSFHVYSSQPANRTIIINNVRLNEGDEVARDLRLVEITPEGVVLQWKQHRFYINNIVENW